MDVSSLTRYAIPVYRENILSRVITNVLNSNSVVSLVAADSVMMGENECGGGSQRN